MYPPLIVDHKDPKWLLLERVLSITTSRRTKQELAKYGITPVSKAGTVMRILLMLMFFVVDCAYVIEELRKRKSRPDTDTTMKQFKNLVKRLLDSLGHQDYFQSIRSLIEDVFKLAKDAFSLQKFHRYTTRSVKKAVSLNVLLSGLVISLGFRSKKQLQQLSEW